MDPGLLLRTSKFICISDPTTYKCEARRTGTRFLRCLQQRGPIIRVKLHLREDRSFSAHSSMYETQTMSICKTQRSETVLFAGFHTNHSRRSPYRSSFPATWRLPCVLAERTDGTCCPRSLGIVFAGWPDRCRGQC